MPKKVNKSINVKTEEPVVSEGNEIICLLSQEYLIEFTNKVMVRKIQIDLEKSL